MQIFNISSKKNFLEELIDGIEQRIDHRLISDTIILLPSHRICAELEYKFSKKHFGKDIIPPKMISIGSIEQLLSFSVLEKLPLLPKPITNAEAKFLLSGLLRKKYKLNNADSLNIASDLFSLISRFDKENIPLNSINKIFIGDLPSHIEIIFDYLKLVSNTWPKLLKEKNVTTTISRRNIFLETLIEKWNTHPPKSPIIIAGSTGTFQSTRKLISKISSLENGFVILQGAENIVHSSIEETDPSFQIYSLITSLNINSQQIVAWNQGLTQTNKDIAHPSFILDSFLQNKNIAYLECRTPQEESKIVAIKTRELLNLGINNIGIITNDKCLRARIEEDLRLWNINFESSDGINFKNTKQYSLIKSIIDIYTTQYSPLSLLNLLHHDFVFLRLEKIDLYKIAYDLEIKYLRGIKKYRNIINLINIVKSKGDNHISSALETLYNEFKPLHNILKEKYATPKNILATIKNIAEKISSNSINTTEIWHGEVGTKAYDIITSCLNILPSTKIHINDFEEILQQAVSDQSILYSFPTKSKVRLLSPIDSRLINFDHIILSGLNEKSWPGSPEIDPWVSSLFYQNIGIPDHRVKIGQSANDFFLLLAQHNQILITRSEQVDGSPQVASRWITNIEIEAQKLGILNQIKTDGLYLRDWADTLITPEYFLEYQIEPPKPPLSVRPKKLSVTQVEKLMRDPYSIYASKILKLKPLEPLDKKPNQLEFGNLIHEIIDTFNKQFSETQEDNYYEKFTEIVEKKLEFLELNPVIHKIWIPRINKIVQYLSKYESSSRSQHKINSEVPKEIEIIKEFSLTAKIDRIETQISGIDSVVADFKTGSIPTQEDIKKGFSPQLTLSAFLVESNDSTQKVVEMVYIQLSSGKKLGQIAKLKGDKRKLIEAAQRGILKIAEKYADPNSSYLICPLPNKAPIYNEFEHLERIDEL
ncbi:MAG: double-strand break repair protein AddB [Alphaproteobacteria bacterium]|nr:double-strand break repair protein AddB [Alphaproteobacteria bacterium]